MKAARAFLVFLACCFWLDTAHAETPSDRFVVVLKPRGLSAEEWPSGTRAVISELVARGYELIVRSSVARTLEALRTELEFAASEPAAVGAVAVFRIDRLGTAYVYTPRSGVVSMEQDVAQGTVAESSLALRVSELFRDPAIPALGERRPAIQERPTGTLPPAPAPNHGALLLGGGFATSEDLSTPAPLIGFGAMSPRWGPLAADVVLSLSPFETELETSAGRIELTFQQLRTHLSFDPWSERDLGMLLALGGGLVWVQESAGGSEAFTGKDDSTRVTVLSARASLFARAGTFRFVIALEPGVMLPAPSIRADGQEIARVGRPWTEFTAGLAWAL